MSRNSDKWKRKTKNEKLIKQRYKNKTKMDKYGRKNTNNKQRKNY